VNANSKALFAMAGTSPIFSPAASSAPDNWTTGGNRYVITKGQSTVYTKEALAVYAFGPQVDGSLDAIAAHSCNVASVKDDPTNCTAAGAEPSAVAMDPYGRYLYVSNEAGGDVSMYALGDGGVLAPIAGNACRNLD